MEEARKERPLACVSFRRVFSASECVIIIPTMLVIFVYHIIFLHQDENKRTGTYN